MSFIQYPDPTPVFPVLAPLTWSVHKKPIMASRATTAISGRENQLACAVYPRWAFTLSYGGGNSWLRDQTQNITAERPLGFTELQAISGLFLQCLGPYGEFYYSDPEDNSRTGQSVGTGNGTQTNFLLFYTVGSGPFIPNMMVPIGGVHSIGSVYVNGSPQDPSTYSVDSTNTYLVFTTPPAANAIVTIDFSFYYRCRFLDDHMKYEQWAQNLWDTKEVRFESVKP